MKIYKATIERIENIKDEGQIRQGHHVKIYEISSIKEGYVLETNNNIYSILERKKYTKEKEITEDENIYKDQNINMMLKDGNNSSYLLVKKRKVH